ncbi:hypothetical protein ACIQM3_28280 [Streptomyces sp. NPDC091271]
MHEYEQVSEARRYSGRAKPADWECPFAAHAPESQQSERELTVSGSGA